MQDGEAKTTAATGTSIHKERGYEGVLHLAMDKRSVARIGIGEDHEFKWQLRASSLACILTCVDRGPSRRIWGIEHRLKGAG